MAPRVLRFIPAFLLLTFCSTAFSEFPDISQLISKYYQTEVQITDVLQGTSAKATEYYNSIDKKGTLKLYVEGNQRLVYYDNSTIIDIVGYNCTAWEADLSEYYYTPIFPGWINRKPTVIGPSAALWYGLANSKDAVKVSTKDGKEPLIETVRSINCTVYALQVKNKFDDLTYYYYFADNKRTTAYNYKNLLLPIRIRINGTSSRYVKNLNKAEMVRVDHISDFASFKLSIYDFNNFLLPTGIGCKQMKKTDLKLDIPNNFQYSAKVVDLLATTEHRDEETLFQTTWYSKKDKLIRRDTDSINEGYRSNLHDFNTGVMYKITHNGSCTISSLLDSEFKTFDYGMSSRMKTPEEVLNLDGNFYEMGRRNFQGIPGHVFESVQFDKNFQRKKYYKLVVTAFFDMFKAKTGDFGKKKFRSPVYYNITGYETPEKKTLELHYRILEFSDINRIQTYSSLRLDKCYSEPDSKIYFVLVIPVEKAQDAELLYLKDEIFRAELRRSIAENARIPELRIPYLKADYKTTGINVTGIMIERPSALLQFFEIDSGPTVTKDPDLKLIFKAENAAECAHACVDEGDFLCKGFYFCEESSCFLKSTDPFDYIDTDKSQDLGTCTEYVRDTLESSNFRQSYLVDAFRFLKKSVSAGNVTVTVKISYYTEVRLTIQDIITSDGPI